MRILAKTFDQLSPLEEARWSELARREGLKSPFLTPGWVRGLLAAEGPDRNLKIAVVEADGEAQAFMPARIGRFTAGPPGAPLCDYQALVGARNLKVDPLDLLSALGVARLDFDKLIAHQPSFRPHVKGAEPAFLVEIGDGLEAYEAGRREAGTDLLKDIAKKRRRLEREGETTFSADAGAGEDFDALIAWKRAQYRATGQTDIFERPWTLRLLKTLLASDDPDCRARLFTLKVGGELAAAHLALCGVGVVHAWFIAYSERFARYSPGSLLIREILAWAAEAGFDRLDLGAGDYRFKRSFASRTRDVTHGFVGRPSAASLVRGAAYGVRGLAESLPLGEASALPGKAMRRLDLIRSLG